MWIALPSLLYKIFGLYSNTTRIDIYSNITEIKKKPISIRIKQINASKSALFKIPWPAVLLETVSFTFYKFHSVYIPTSPIYYAVFRSFPNNHWICIRCTRLAYCFCCLFFSTVSVAQPYVISIRNAKIQYIK